MQFYQIFSRHLDSYFLLYNIEGVLGLVLGARALSLCVFIYHLIMFMEFHMLSSSDFSASKVKAHPKVLEYYKTLSNQPLSKCKTSSVSNNEIKTSPCLKESNKTSASSNMSANASHVKSNVQSTRGIFNVIINITSYCEGSNKDGGWFSAARQETNQNELWMIGIVPNLF